jgi:hypothetical protein
MTAETPYLELKLSLIKIPLPHLLLLIQFAFSHQTDSITASISLLQTSFTTLISALLFLSHTMEIALMPLDHLPTADTLEINSALRPTLTTIATTLTLSHTLPLMLAETHTFNKLPSPFQTTLVLQPDHADNQLNASTTAQKKDA